MEYLNNLPPLLKTFWFVAIPASVIFVIQAIMTFAGGDASDGVQADFDGDLDGGHMPFQIFSLRNLVNFLLGFSWCGISFYNIISNHALLIVFSLASGIGFVLLFFLILRQVHKLAEDNSFKMSDTLNQPAEVYLTIPGYKTGRGKVLVSTKGSVRELIAITTSDKIESGTMVKVTGIEQNSILIVEKI
jgi:hypothetical protein